MKKLVIALSAVALAIGAQAAAIDWKMTINAATSGGIPEADIGNYAAYFFDSSTWSSSLEGGKLNLTKALDSSGFVLDGIKFTTDTQTFETTAASINYNIVLVDSTNDKWSIVSSATATSYDPQSSSGTLASSTTTGQRVLGTAASGNLSWTAGTTNVPEPTSGLLMLLGIAGLALKRRHV